LPLRKLGIILAIFFGSRFAFPAPQLPCRSATEYRALLGSLEQRSTALTTSSLPELLEAIPDQCDLTVSGHAFHLSTARFKNDLRGVASESDEDRRKARLKSFQARLQKRVKALEAYEQPVDPTAKPKLQEILQRREFRRVSGEDAMAVLKEWVFQLVIWALSRILKDPVQAVLAAKIFAWSACLIAAAFVLWKLCRWAIRKRPLGPPREAIPSSSSVENWRNWLNEARAAVARGELREAVHAGYWAVISQLETSMPWRVDRARTPREYLALVGQADPARPLLAEITRDFEVVWYGNRVPSAQEWESFLTRVEQIGCR